MHWNYGLQFAMPCGAPLSTVRKSLVLAVTAILLLAFAVSAYATTLAEVQQNLDKYWDYRAMQRTNFIRVGTGQGCSMPACWRNLFEAQMCWGDSTIDLGWYIGALATEHYMLSNPSIFPGYSFGGGDINVCRDELQKALAALDRVDATGENAIQPGFPDQPGFFIRDDVPDDYYQYFSGMTNIFSDYSNPDWWAKEMSQDQACHLMLGLTLVKKLIPSDLWVNGMNLRSAAIQRGGDIVDWIHVYGWIIRDPVTGTDVVRGPDARSYAKGFNLCCETLTDGQRSFASSISGFWISIWNSLNNPSNPAYSNANNRHMAMVLAAGGNGWSDGTLNALMSLADAYDWYAYPMLYAVVHDGVCQAQGAWPGHKATINSIAQAQMNLAPASGPHHPNNPSEEGTGWCADRKFWRDLNSQNYGGGSIGHEFTGLDYLVLHNLFYIITPSNWQDPTQGASQTPYAGVIQLPGTAQAENFDNGGEGVAYHDLSGGNAGGAYRSTDVDIEGCSEGGYNVGWIDTGEWLEYTVNVANSGAYNIITRVASPNSGCSFHIEMNGQNVTGSKSVPNTGGWQNWADVTANGCSLNAGEQIMRLVVENGGWNVNYIQVSAVAGTNSALYVSDTIPGAMTAGQTYNCTVTMQNNGTTTWTNGSGPTDYNFGPWDAPPGPNINWAPRADCVSNIAPGQQCTFNLSITPPAGTTPGPYDTTWGMVQETVQWFQNMFTKPITINSSDTTAPTFGGSISPSITNSLTPTITITCQDTGSGLNVGSAEFCNSVDSQTSWATYVGRYVLHSKGTGSGGGNRYWYPDFYHPASYTIAAGDHLQYDIYLNNTDGKGAIDLEGSFGNLRDSGKLDQNGLGAHANTNLYSQAYHQWYHRDFDLSSWAGHTIAAYEMAHESDSGVSEFYVRNVLITNNGLVKDKAANSDAWVPVGNTVAPISDGYSSTVGPEMITPDPASPATCTGTNGTTAVQNVTATFSNRLMPLVVGNTNRIKFHMTDMAGNMRVSSVFTITVDQTAPTCSIGTPNPTSVNQGQSFTYPVTYADNIGIGSVNLTTAKVHVQTVSGNASATVSSVSNGTTTTPTVNLTNATGNGTLRIYIDAGAATDLAGNTDAGATAGTVVTVTGGPVTLNNSTFDADANGWSLTVWRASTAYGYGTMAWNSSCGRTGGGLRCSGTGSSDNTDRCTREGGEAQKTISTAGYSNIKVYYDLRVNTLGQNNTGTGSGSCAVDHNLIDEQITVFYSTNGGSSWTEAEYLLRSALLSSYQSYGTRMIDLTGVPAVNNNPNFRLRFRWQVNSGADLCDLDNIKVTSN